MSSLFSLDRDCGDSGDDIDQEDRNSHGNSTHEIIEEDHHHEKDDHHEEDHDHDHDEDGDEDPGLVGYCEPVSKKKQFEMSRHFFPSKLRGQPAWMVPEKIPKISWRNTLKVS